MKSSTIRYSLSRIIKKYFLLLLFGISSLLFAEDIDSLYNVTEIYTGVPRIEAFLQIGYQNRSSNYDEAIRTLNIAYNEAIKLNLRDLQAKALFYKGLTYHYADETEKALHLLNESVELFRLENDIAHMGKSIGWVGTVYLRLTGDQAVAMTKFNEALVYSRKAEDYLNMAIIYSQVSNIFRLEGAYSQAIEFIIKSREQYEKAEYHEGAAWITYCIGRIYTTMNLYEEAKKTFSESLERYQVLPESFSTSRGEAISHDELGMSYLKLGDIALARMNNQEAMSFYEELNLDFGLSNACKYRALIEFTDGNHELALKYLNKSKDIKKSINDALGFPGLYKLYGEILFAKNMFQPAVDSLKLGLNHAVQNRQKSITISLCSLLSDIYSSHGDYKQAYEFKSKQIALSDSISQSKAIESISQVQALYEIEKQEEKIKQLEQENLLNEIDLEREITVRNLLLIILSMAIIFAFFMLKLFASNRHTNETLKENQDKLQELNATKDKFTSIIAHDLKSPFNTLIGFSALLHKASENKDFDKVKEYSMHIESVSTQTYKLLENLLEWSRTQTGKISFEPKAIDVRTPIKRVVELMKPIAGEKEIIIDLNISPVAILADENMLLTILQNLISNAIKYSHHGGKIKISASEAHDMLELSIKDSGIGMSKEKCSKLFMLDESISEPGTNGERGTGLGLILCKEFAEQHRGRIDVQSELGKGSCFTLYLPL